MPPFPGFPNKAHRSPVHLIHFIPIPGRYPSAIGKSKFTLLILIIEFVLLSKVGESVWSFQSSDRGRGFTSIAYARTELLSSDDLATCLNWFLLSIGNIVHKTSKWNKNRISSLTFPFSCHTRTYLLSCSRVTVFLVVVSSSNIQAGNSFFIKRINVERIGA